MDNSASSGSISVTSSTIDGTSFASTSTGWSLSGDTVNVPADAIVAGETTSCTPSLPTAPTFVVGNCITDPGGAGGTHTFGPANASSTICYKGLTMGANGGTTTLNPGTYVIYGNYLTFDTGSGGHSNLGGNGVFFYLTNGAELVMQGGANVNLVSGGATKNGGGTAPSVGVNDGILIYQPSSDTAVLGFNRGGLVVHEWRDHCPRRERDYQQRLRRDREGRTGGEVDEHVKRRQLQGNNRHQ